MRFLRDCLLEQAARRGLALRDHLVHEAGAPAAAGSGGGAGGGGGGGVHELLALLESVLGREESAQVRLGFGLGLGVRVRRARRLG